MFRKIMLAAASAVAITGVCAVASAQVVPLELEGPLNAFEVSPVDQNAGTLTVMGMPVIVDAETEFVTPTADRSSAINPATGFLYTLEDWVKGNRFRGRATDGLIDATVIVTGFWDEALQAVYAEEVFSDVAENVILGVITASNCSNLNCTGPGNGIVLNGGTYVIPNRDARLPFNRAVDGGLFEVNLSKGNLNGLAIGAEGYYSSRPIPLTPLMGEDPGVNPETSEPLPFRNQALVYWDFAFADIQPTLLRFPNRREVSVLRVRCEVGDRLEVRGWVRQQVNAAGVGNNANVGSIRVTMRIPGQDDIVSEEADFVPELNSAYARYQLRQDVPNCAEEVQVDWMIGGNAVASTTAPVDRLRD